MEPKYDVVFSFDTTGSMSACIGQVRKNIKESVAKLFKEMPGMRIGIIAHGDYCDEKDTYLYKQVDLTNDQKKVIDFITNVGNTCGGDYPEAYEYVLYKAQELSWDSTAMRSLVMIGDAPPHAVNDNPGKLDWRHEVDELFKMNVNIYSVQALSYGKGESYTFYKQMASKTNGYHLFLDQFSYITDMFMAICYKQHSQERVEQYEQEMKKNSEGLTLSMRKMFDTLLNRKTAEVKDDAVEVEYDPDDDKITTCPPAKYQILKVDADMTIKEFVVKNGSAFKTGKGFYEFTKPETIGDKKLIVLMKKDTGELYEGKKARKIAGINGDKTKYRPSDLKDYKVFIQSTSATRKLVKDTSFLYEATDWMGK